MSYLLLVLLTHDGIAKNSTVCETMAEVCVKFNTTWTEEKCTLINKTTCYIPSCCVLRDSTVFIFVLCTQTVRSPPYAASQAPVPLHLLPLLLLSVSALIGLRLAELRGKRYGLPQKVALFLRVWGRGACGTRVFVFVVARLEGQGWDVRGSLLIATLLAPPLQGVQSRPVGPRASGAPLGIWMQCRVGLDAGTAPPSP